MGTELDDLTFAFAVLHGGPDQIFRVKAKQLPPPWKPESKQWRSYDLCHMHLRAMLGGKGLGDTPPVLEAIVKQALQLRNEQRFKPVNVAPRQYIRECGHCRWEGRKNDEGNK